MGTNLQAHLAALPTQITVGQFNGNERLYVSDGGLARWLDPADLVSDTSKLDLITVTGAVDLDEIASRVDDLDAAVVLQGGWDASAGTFPGAGSAQAGHSWIVTVAGVVDGIDFQINDRLLAITNDASTNIYASNWLKLDYTDQVLSVVGQTGAVTATQILTGLLDVDGAGSGLDADLLDGSQAAAFAQLAGSQTFTGANAFSGNLTIGGRAIATTSTTTISTATANDVAVPERLLQQINPSGGSRTITGFSAASSQLWFVENISSTNNLTLAHNDSGSSSVNRLLCDTGQNIVLRPRELALVRNRAGSLNSVWKIRTRSTDLADMPTPEAADDGKSPVYQHSSTSYMLAGPFVASDDVSRMVKLEDEAAYDALVSAEEMDPTAFYFWPEAE